MYHEIILPFRPATTDCLAWSGNGQLAIAAGDFVHIFIFDNSDQPTEVEFQINKFTTQEWPMQELEPLDDFSIGQEQSLSNVTQLSWSPAGYTKYLHPILAVLTSNCVLSLWASSSDPYDSATWERVLVVNNVIHASLQQQGLTSNSQSRAKLRLRNMSWSPPRYVNQDMSTLDGRTLSSLGATKTLPHLYFAVINEADEALIIQGDNPYADSDTSGGRNNPTWAATILKSGTWGQIQGFSQEQEASQPTTQPGIHSGFSAFGLSMQRTRVLDNISWGPWNESGNETLLTLRRAGRISHHVLHLADDTSSAEFLSPQQGESLSIEEDSQVTILSPIYGPATWFQKAGTQDVLHASALVSTVEVFKSNRQNEPTKAFCHKLESEPGEEMFWDHISGLSVCSQGEETYIYISKVLYGLEVLHVEQDSYKKLETSPLQDRMEDLHKDWDHENEMGGLSIMKTWGVASWGSSVASCVTFHPGDMIENALAHDEGCVVIVRPCV